MNSKLFIALLHLVSPLGLPLRLDVFLLPLSVLSRAFGSEFPFPQWGRKTFPLDCPLETVPHLILNSRKPYGNKLVFDSMNKKTFVFLSFSRNLGLRNTEKWCYFYLILTVSLLWGNGTYTQKVQFLKAYLINYSLRSKVQWKVCFCQGTLKTVIPVGENGDEKRRISMKSFPLLHIPVQLIQALFLQ